MSKYRVILSGVVGNALEFYDFTLYGVFATILSQHFFPSHDPFVSLISSWGAFAAGFFMRPIGALIFGHFGDKYGRKHTLTFSIVMMGVPTIIIGSLPGYQTIGVLAPIALVVCRLAQGLCTGGEYNGAAIFTLEHLKRNPGLAGGLITGSCVVGALAATGIGSILTQDNMPDYMWRIAFWFGGILSFIGFLIRKDLDETPDFASHKLVNKDKKVIPLMGVIKTHTNQILIVMISGGLNGALSYTLFGFMNSYLHIYKGLSLSLAMKVNLFGLVVFMFSSPFFGLISDKITGRYYFLYASLAVAVFVFPSFMLFQQGELYNILLAQGILGLLTGAIAGPQHAFLQNLFSVEHRYTGISFGFCTGMALGGGTAPLLMTYFIQKTNNMFVPAIYIASISFLCFSAIYAYYVLSDSRGKHTLAS